MSLTLKSISDIMTCDDLIMKIENRKQDIIKTYTRDGAGPSEEAMSRFRRRALEDEKIEERLSTLRHIRKTLCDNLPLELRYEEPNHMIGGR